MSKPHNPPCDNCGKARGKTVKSYRLEPRNWAQRFQLLCPDCRRTLGYTPVSHDRPYVGMQAQRLMR